MDHFDGITPEQRWKNDILNEQRKTNELLEKLIGHTAQMPETKEKTTGSARGTSKQNGR